MSTNNPYQPQNLQPQNYAPHQQMQASRDLPTYSTVVFIIDLVFSVLRVLLFIASLLALASGVLQGTAFMFGIFETISSFFMVLFAVPGNILCLMRNPLGPKLMWGAVIATSLSLIIGIIQIATMAPWDAGGPEMVGFVIGGGFSILLRVGIIGAIIIALKMAKEAGSFLPVTQDATYPASS